ncbi:MAG: ribbon-helix-helix protein, CopG family [Deltaproteobacteria bacterium]|nr:ribbon-helix-helix protein, CopG family [Deltaproteobacteria bacterium]
MKTAVSLPDDLFADADACARRLKLSRSGLLAAALREYLARHGPTSGATDAWNRALAEAGREDALLTPAIRRYTRRRVRRSKGW